MFDAHKKYVDDVQRLTLYPKVINIDRERTENNGNDTTIRSTREWAQTLKTAQGHSLRCDVENGGSDRRAYLLVVSQHLDRAKIELHNYLQALNTATRQSREPTDDDWRQTDPQRPTEIYIPTPAVLTNLKFLNTLTSEEVWKSAPTAIRSPMPQARTHHATNERAAPTAQPPKMDTPRPLNPPTHPHQKTSNYPPAACNRELNNFPPLNSTEARQDDTTVGTTASNFTRTTYHNNQTAFNNKFKELEDQINSHSQEFQAIHNRFDSLNEKILRNMQIASEHSKNFSQMERQVNDMNTAIQTLLERSNNRNRRQHSPDDSHSPSYYAITPATQDTCNFANVEQCTDESGHKTVAIAIAGSSSRSVASASTDSRKSVESIPISSPEKKRIRSNDQPHSHTDVQESSAQYDESTPVDLDL